MVGRDRDTFEHESRAAAFTYTRPARLSLVDDRRLRLRLVEADAPLPPLAPSLSPTIKPQPHQPAPPRPQGDAIGDPADPRWVLAVRTSELLEGPVLRPEKRERLIRIGKIMGLSPFDANLVIAIVQDQARRGYPAGECPTAGEPQLRMVPLPKFEYSESQQRMHRIIRIGLIIAVAVAVEIAVLKWVFS